MGIVRQLFGPSRKEIWQQLSEKVSGRYVAGGFLKGDKVQVEHGEWTLTLDSFVVPAGKVMLPFTRMRAPFVNPGGFRFTVYRKSIFSGLAKAFGMQDIEVGDPPFDHDFIVQATDETLARTLLSGDRIRGLIAQQRDIKFTVKDDEGWFGTRFPGNVDELSFEVAGTIKDLDRLKLLYDLFAETLEALCRIGSGTETAPPVTLT